MIHTLFIVIATFILVLRAWRPRRSQVGPKGPALPPVSKYPNDKKYDNIAWRCLVAVFFFFSVITHIIVINNNINKLRKWLLHRSNFGHQIASAPATYYIVFFSLI